MLTADTHTNVLLLLHSKIADATPRLALAAAAKNSADVTDGAYNG